MKNVSINDVLAAPNLEELNDLLTKSMAQRDIQALIKEESLETISQKVIQLNLDVGEDLLSAAILGRLAAVARGREKLIYGRANEIFTKQPPSVESLSDGDTKSYAAVFLSYVKNSWILEYSYREAINIDTADNARNFLLSANLERVGNVSLFLNDIAQHVQGISKVNNHEVRARKIRRIAGTIQTVVERWQGDIGTEVGSNLSLCLSRFFPEKPSDIEDTITQETIDSFLFVLCRIIQLRFSKALEHSTYEVLSNGRKCLGFGLWGRFLSNSRIINQVRVALLESVLVIARQNRTDQQIIAALIVCYSSKSQAANAIKRHFQNAKDLDPEIAEWWKSAGNVSEIKSVEHKVGNNEDSQIGALLIEVESNREAMDKVGRAVVPLLEISEPILASTVKKAVDGYINISQVVGRLARMRKLSKTDLKGERLEFNPLEHEMLGGNRPGIRLVRVVRDGIKKEFSGKIKTLVKPWVEPIE